MSAQNRCHTKQIHSQKVSVFHLEKRGFKSIVYIPLFGGGRAAGRPVNSHFFTQDLEKHASRAKYYKYIYINK